MKSLPPTDDAGSSSSKKMFTQGTGPSPKVSDGDMERHLQELQNEYSKSAPNSNHVKALLKQTYDERTKMRASQKVSMMNEVFKLYPCFKECVYVSIQVGPKEMKPCLGLLSGAQNSTVFDFFGSGHLEKKKLQNVKDIDMNFGMVNDTIKVKHCAKCKKIDFKFEFLPWLNKLFN